MKKVVLLTPLILGLLASCAAVKSEKEESNPDPTPEPTPEPVIVEPVYSYVFNSDSPIRLVKNAIDNSKYYVGELSFNIDDTIKFVDSSVNPYKLVEDISISGERYGFSYNTGVFKASIEGIYSFALTLTENGNKLVIEKKELPVVNTYTVRFNANGHGSAPASIKNVEEGSKISKPTDPSASGYIFEGWYKEKECTNAWDFNTDVVTSDITLYAKWSLAPIETYTVTFDTQGHGIAPSNIENVEKGSKISKPTDPTDEGFQFKGWFKESSCKNEWKFNVDTVTKDLTLFAKWEEVLERYFVVFDNTTSPFDIDYGVELTRISNLSYKVSLTREQIRPATIIKIVDSKNNEYKGYDTTTNSFTNYYVKIITSGLQFVVYGSYTIEIDPTNSTTGIKVTNTKVENYSLFEVNMNSSYYEDLTFTSSSSTSIVWMYHSYQFGENYTYSIRAYINSNLKIIQNISLSSRSTSKFNLNGNTFTYKKGIFKETFDVTLTLDVETLALELDMKLL